ncbi:Adipocyte plasma membrane-associated protein [Bagarius yarrelli]|uniref:Adipocyte plasma membrane-associated protein n=1 Tax=Bagarius yarrelli TaxID=175774 RepID=A0A556TR96_BAGYA|nr:Adipocyte plasma membrane-associated protein [Bagarius yarrelli]
MNEPEGLRFRKLNRPQILTDEPHQPQHKNTSTYSGKVFRVTLLSLAAFLVLPVLVVTFLLESPIQPEAFSLNEPPLLAGCFEPNLKLRQAERLFEDQLIGPESLANIGDVLYTGTADGEIVKLDGKKISIVATLGKPPCGSPEKEHICGRPLGIKVGPNGTLFVADAYLGLFEVNPVTGEKTHLVTTNKLIAGRRLSFVNDLDVTQDGKKVYFTDSSSRWQRRDFMKLLMEATADGRVLEYDTETKEVTVMMENLRFPNGIQLLPDEESVLVAETTMARIRKIHVAGLNKGGMDTFIENLPGFPDNLRRSSSGGYWVAMSAVRPNPGFSMLDFLSQRPWIKNLIFKLFSQETLMKFVPRYSLVVELQSGGTCVRSFHDPHGTVAAYISEAHEHNGHLYLGSFRSPYLCKLDLRKV